MSDYKYDFTTEEELLYLISTSKLRSDPVLGNTENLKLRDYVWATKWGDADWNDPCAVGFIRNIGKNYIEVEDVDGGLIPSVGIKAFKNAIRINGDQGPIILKLYGEREGQPFPRREDTHAKRMEEIVRAVADRDDDFIIRDEYNCIVSFYCAFDCEVINAREIDPNDPKIHRHHPDCPAALAVELVKEMDREEKE